LEKDSDLACVRDDSDSPGGEEDISSRDSAKIIPFRLGSSPVSPTLEMTSSRSDINPTLAKETTPIPPGGNDLPDLTEKNLGWIVSGIFGGNIEAARELVRRCGGDLAPLQAAIHAAMAAPELARPRAFQYALDDARAAAGLWVFRRADRWPIAEVTERDFFLWTQVKLGVYRDEVGKELLELTGSIQEATKIVNATNGLPPDERLNYVFKERERRRYMLNSDAGDDWPRNYEDLFWEMYPTQIRKPEAGAELKRLRAQGVSFTDIIRGARRYSIESEKTDPKYVKYPDNWLKGGCWSDEWARACA
jgi:hypothetical protein